MATRDSQGSSRFNDARAGEQARAEDAAHVGGMAGAFSRAFAMGPQVFALQQALLAGMVQSQQREAERLAARHGIDDERVGGALERAARFDELGAAAVAGGEVASRLAETFQQKGVFHGYVAHADGAAAADYTVRLEWQGDAGVRRGQRGSANTDEDGYFRIEFGVRDAAASDDVAPLTRWLQALAEDPAPEEPAIDGTGSSDARAQAGVTSSVQVLAPSGSVVFEDPSPPDFDPLPSEFRYYVLPDVDGTAGKATRGARRRG